ncbi:RNA polymerase sigma factor for flagellar operon FliA [Variovorax boronicumulans]|uniref:sigma-70 family RNA polymerase sigma factor n=1 Tax=Variovorax boronicumulans TaxID=436515 RepID=UPI002786C0F1|nr:sigma-70 family RNA polymerase sigma factor [Variovorax boronicumulans]MDQ0069698.1 RNA polymerase sigma factor for flagellar operon FliA [Variovorax boronicumulans]
MRPSPQPFFDPAAEPGKLGDVTSEAPDVTVALWARWRKEKDEAAREQLICHYLPYAKMVAATIYGRRTHNDVEFEDYLQLARVGLLEAVDRFEPGQGAQFKTFAAKRVQGSVLNGLTRLTEKNQQISVAMRLRQERLEAVKDAAAVAEEASGDGQAAASAAPRSADKLFKYLAEVGIGLALGVLLEDTGMVDGEAFDGNAHAPSPEVSYFRKTEILQLRTVLRDLVNQLSDQQKSVIRQHYLQEVPFDDIATLMGVTRGRVSQLHRQGLLRLRELLAKDARCDVSL